MWPFRQKIKWKTDSGFNEIARYIEPVYLEQVKIVCPECVAETVWTIPEGFKIAIAGTLLVTCHNGHNWAIGGLYQEKKQ
jgi:hypothetical protein